MAESVDALVSNTSRFTPVPVRPRLWVPREKFERTSLFFVPYNLANRWFMYPEQGLSAHGQGQNTRLHDFSHSLAAINI